MLSMCKYYASEVAVKASGLAVQLLGAAGYMEENTRPRCFTATHVNSRSSKAPARSNSVSSPRASSVMIFVGLTEAQKDSNYTDKGERSP